MARVAFAVAQRDSRSVVARTVVIRGQLPAYVPPIAAAAEKIAIIVAQQLSVVALGAVVDA